MSLYKLFGKEPVKTKILVAMSGGVDSSLTAVLLKKLGYNLIGCTLQLAAPSCGLGACCTGRDLIDVKKICEDIGIEHVLVKARDEFKQQVIQRTIDTYAKGLTPSPCVWCNSKVRFDFLLKAALERGCDGFVTGHYAWMSYEDERYYINAGVDHTKDQSYFLSMLKPEILQYIRFPLGNMHKSVVRRLAKRFNIHVADKGDSQDLCFVKDTYTQTLWNLAPHIFAPGNIVDVHDNVLGEHEGIAGYTIGQRKGLRISDRTSIDGYKNKDRGKVGKMSIDLDKDRVNSMIRIGKIDVNDGNKTRVGIMSNEEKKGSVVNGQGDGPIYVVDIKSMTNEVIVGGKADGLVRIIILENVNFFAEYIEGMFVMAKVRARSETVLARLWRNGCELEFVMPIYHPARGQFAIMYQERRIVACGMISDFVRWKRMLINA